MADTTRDTIYIDIDDEITGIIDKVRSSNAKVVALVLPKRAAVFQSVVNMKLLKRATEQAKKHIVLITAEAGLLPLAGAVGVHVARTLTSKPEIPAPPISDDGREETVEEAASLDDVETPEVTVATAGDTPVGELAGFGVGKLGGDGIETVELDDEDDALPITASAATASAATTGDAKKMTPAKKVSKNGKLKVPNFERFRILLILLVLLIIILIVAGYYAFSVLPKAAINIQTDAANVNTDVSLTLDTNATGLNTQTNVVPAKQVTEQKTYSATVAASGQQNNGQEASGSVTLSIPCTEASGIEDVPAGTGVSVNSDTYITQNNAVLNNPTGSSHSCNLTATTPITATQPGSSYNTSSTSTTFTLAPSSDNSYNASNITVTGSASGGTDNIQTIVEQSDIASAESKIATQTSTVKNDLEQQLQGDNLYAIPATLNSGNPVISPSTNAGSPASNVTVTETITYSMYGVPQSDLTTLLNNNIKSQVNTATQSILNTGLSNASFTTNGSSDTGLTMTSTAEVGPNINQATIKKQAEGQKSGSAEAAIKSDPDVTNVTVKLSPFWVSTIPKNASKITVTVAKPTSTASNANNN